jgi:short-subunit dehydrogenase
MAAPSSSPAPHAVVTTRPVALVTGASAGIGRAFAIALAARGYDLVLVARDEERLGALAQRLQADHGAAGEVLVADLTDPEATARVAERVRDGARPVELLVNNAGFSTPKSFAGSELAEQQAQLDVLVRAVLVLSHAAVPVMVARGHGAIITVSSVAGFIHGGSYSAAKAWATTFSLSLATELEGTGVRVLVLCPGFVRTEFHQRMGLKQEGPDWAWLDADRLVADCLADLAAGRSLSIPSRRYRALTALARHAPIRAVQRIGRIRMRMRARAAR